jgi:hypothetical protein
MEERAWSSTQHSKVAVEVLGFDPTKSTWTDLEMDLLLKIGITTGNVDEPSGRSQILVATGFALHTMAQAFASTMNRNAQAIKEAAGLGDANYRAALPWLPWIDRRITSHDAFGFQIPIQGFNVEQPLAGQHIEDLKLVVGLVKLEPMVIHMTEFEAKFGELLLLPNDPRIGTPIVILTVMSMGFDEGSLFHWIKVRAGVLALGVSLLGISPVSKTADYLANEYTLHNAIVHALKVHSPAVEFRGFRFSSSELDKVGIRAFNYEEPGITEDEKLHRIALCQLTFRIIFRTDIAIDGKLGPETVEHLKRLAALHNLPASIKNAFLRTELLNALHPPFPKL